MVLDGKEDVVQDGRAGAESELREGGKTEKWGPILCLAEFLGSSPSSVYRQLGR